MKAVREHSERGDAVFIQLQSHEDLCFYIPHSLVVHPENETTKYRVVFDASCKNQDGVSLNDTILKTPALHPTLTGILLRYRHLYGMTADISKMFLNMDVCLIDRKCHRFPW